MCTKKLCKHQWVPKKKKRKELEEFIGRDLRLEKGNFLSHRFPIKAT